MQQYGMNMEILGKVAFVTGGASGLELATSRLLHTEGASVVVVDRDRDRGKAVVAEMGERAAFVQADVTAEGDVTRNLDAAAELGGLDIVVNCAGAVTASWVVGKKGPASAR